MNRLAYGNGIFVGIYGGYYAYSTNGTDWNENDLSYILYDVIFADGQFVAVGNDDGYPIIATSTDGSTWTTSEISTNQLSLFGITYGNGLYVCSAADGNRIYSSSDLSTWTTSSSLPDTTEGRLAYGNGVFAMIADYDNGDIGLWYSTDAVSWTKSKSISNGNADESDIVFGNGIFIVALNTTNTTNIYYSTDAVTWNSTSLSVGGYLSGLATNDIKEERFFSSDIIPVFTSNSTTLTKTDALGEWKIQANSVTITPVNAVDSSTSTYWQSDTIASGSTVRWWILCPVKIKPKQITVNIRYWGGGQLQGRDPDTLTWINLKSLPKTSSNNTTYLITTNSYFDAFRVTSGMYSSSSNQCRLIDFQLVSGSYLLE